MHTAPPAKKRKAPGVSAGPSACAGAGRRSAMPTAATAAPIRRTIPIAFHEKSVNKHDATHLAPRRPAGYDVRVTTDQANSVHGRRLSQQVGRHREERLPTEVFGLSSGGDGS
ncbi:hypothetical protein SNE510_63260 [Streptomyces sp. NE5-10]|nr:hypothetical protein SNE510_63260 [Streptomyces sp. NE5-10]